MRDSNLLLELASPEPPIISTCLEQLSVSAFPNGLPVSNHEYLICIYDRRQSVGNNEVTQLTPYGGYSKTEESVILVLARNGHPNKIRSHHHILVTRPGNNMGIIPWDLE